MATTGVNNYVSLYSSRAHIFQIDKETRSKWIEKGSQAIPISLVVSVDQASNSAEHRAKRELKIIGTNEAGNTVLDAVITPSTVFNRRSQKFGQWNDPTGEVYGLGFNSEGELASFAKTFSQLQNDVLLAQNHNNTTAKTIAHPERPASTWVQQQYDIGNTSETNGRSAPTNVSHNSGISQQQQQQYSNVVAHTAGPQNPQQQQEAGRSSNPTGPSSSYSNNKQTNGNNNDSLHYPRSQSMFGMTKNSSFAARESNGNAFGHVIKNTPEPGASPLPGANDWHIRDQLKYENERLKQALEESSKNAQIWNKELLNLRTNNVKLTQALQESKAHVEEWERELVNLRKENKELKSRLTSLESHNGLEKGDDLREDLYKYKGYVEECQNELKRKEDEVETMRKEMEKLQMKASDTSHQSNGGHTDDKNPDDVTIKPHQKQKFDVINAKLEAKLGDLINVQKEFSQLLDNLYC